MVLSKCRFWDFYLMRALLRLQPTVQIRNKIPRTNHRTEPRKTASRSAAQSPCPKINTGHSQIKAEL